MTSHDDPLLLGEGTGLLEDVVRDTNLAHVVHGGCRQPSRSDCSGLQPAASARARAYAAMRQICTPVSVSLLVARLAQHDDGGAIAALELIEAHQER